MARSTYGFLFRPIWLFFHLIVVGGIVLMVNLGIWQLNRLDERKTFNRELTERAAAAPVSLETLLGRIEAGDLSIEEAEWQRVEATGVYLPDQIVEFNVSQGGRAGENVLAALVTSGAERADTPRTVIVNRGFIPLPTAVPELPAVESRITGFVRPSESRRRGQLTDAAPDGSLTEVRRIDLAQLAAHYGGDVAPVFIQLTASVPPIGDTDPQPVVLPDLDDGPHLSYAVQWFVFSAFVALGWVLAVRRSLRQRRRDLAQQDDSPTGMPTGDEIPTRSALTVDEPVGR